MNVACPQCTSVFRVDPAKVPAGGVRARCSVCSGVINVPEPSFEEPVAATPSAGWPGGQVSSWGHVATPAGGWTPPPPATPATPPTPQAAPRTYTPAPAGTPPAHTPVEAVTNWPTPSESSSWGDWPSAEPPPPPAEEPSNPWGDFNANPLSPEAFRAAAPQPVEDSWQDASAAAIDQPQPEELIPAAAPHQEMPAQAGSHVNPFLRRDPHERARRLARALASDIVTYYPEKHAEGMRDGTLRELFREEIKKSYDDYVAHVGAELAQSTNYFKEALNEVLAGGKRLF